MKLIVFMTLILVMCIPAYAGVFPSGKINPDEDLVFYPVFGWLDDSATTWTVELHASVYEAETDSLWRNAFIHEFADITDLDELTTAQTLTLNTRLRLFMVDHERNQRIRLKLAGRELVMDPTARNGHAKLMAQIPVAALKADTVTTRPVWIECEAVLPRKQTRKITGRIQLIPAQGVSVVSDIDDTIKVTGILDRKQMVANTFWMPAQAVAGMAELYRSWADSGAAFHYVSGSPWQLAGPLEDLIASAGFPAGSLHLRFFRFTDRSLVRFLAGDVSGHKKEQIERLLEVFPRRTFILVGDTGERDPEIYGDIARRHPGRVKMICLRKVEGSELGEARWEKAFEGVPRESVKVFGEAREIHKVRESRLQPEQKTKFRLKAGLPNSSTELFHSCI